MTNDDVLEEFRQAGALREGHFVLSSGLDSRFCLQKNPVFMYPERTERLWRALAQAILERVGQVDVCVSPAVGGIIPGYETARHLRVPSIYFEPEDGVLSLRRAFGIEAGARVAIVEGIVSTGLSSRECVDVDAVRDAGGDVICASCIVDLSGDRAKPGAPLVTLAKLDVPAYAATALSADLTARHEEDSGSRRLRQ